MDIFYSTDVGKWSVGQVFMVRKKLPIGIDGFEKIRTNDFYYADKTLFIKELLQNWGEVNLFTRPRRFGKSLNMSMLKCYLRSERIRRCSRALKSCGKRACVRSIWESSP